MTRIVIDIEDEVYSDITHFSVPMLPDIYLFIMANAIANGKVIPKVNGDLISRSALKEDFADMREGYPIFSDTEMLSTKDIAKIIDNAPTVIPFASVQYETFREYERPIGKWLNNRVAFHFTCDYCGCNIRQLKDEVFEGDYDYNFCPNCGAEMKKGGKDGVEDADQ